MDVNYEVWGTPETWVDGNTSEQRADIKYPAAAQDTFRENYQNGHIPWNEIDLSLSYWGIGKGSIWANPHLLYPYCPTGTLANLEVDEVSPIEEEISSIPAIFTVNNSINSTYVSYSRRYKNLYPEEQTTGMPLGNSYSVKLLAGFNYQKVMIIPYVYYYDANTDHGGFSYSTYKDFFDNINDRIGYKILGIAYKIRYGDGETNRTSEGVSFGLVWPTEYRGNTGTYDSRPYFASAEGMGHLTETAFMTAGTVPAGLKTADQRGDATIGTSETGFRKQYCVNTGTSVPIYYYDKNNELWEVYKNTYVSGSYTQWVYFPCITVRSDNIQAVQEYLISQIAYLGLPFVIDPAVAAQGKIGDTGVYLPKFDDDGVTTGEYAEGTAALALPNAEWVDGRTGSGYDPTKPTPGPGPEDSTDWQRNPTSTTQSGSWPFIGSTLYAMTQNRFNSAYSWMQSLYAECLEAFNEDRMSDTFWNFGMGMSIADVKLKYRLARLSSNMNSQNYLDSVMSVMRYPFDVRPYLNTIDAEGIHWGSVYQDDDNSGIVINPTTYEVKGWGSGNSFMVPGGTLHYDRYYGNFLDYAPYSEAELYIPYCGAVKLDPQVYCGHDIKVNYLVDFNSGACLALVYRDNLICDQISGQMGIPINFTAPDIQSYNNSVFNGTQVVKANQQALTYNLASNALEFSKEGTSIAQEAAASYAKKDIAGMANALPNPFDVGQQALNFSNQLSTNLRNLKTAEYNLEHVQLGFKQISSSSTQTSTMNEQTVRLIVYRPTFLPEYRSSSGAADKYDSDKFRTYAHTTGFACLINNTLSQFTGLTICGSVNTNDINATESEKNLLETALKTGVYL